MRVLLINPPDELEAMLGAGREFVQKYEPLGLLYVAASAREAGHDVAVIDAYAEELSVADLQRRIEARQPDVIGLSTLTCNGAAVHEIGRWVKAARPDVRVVLGNIHAAVFARQYLEEGCCDAVVHGEGDHVFAEILAAYARGDDPEGLGSVSYRDADGGIVEATHSAEVADLSGLPVPARDLVDQRQYSLTEFSNQSYVGEGGGDAKTMSTQRGCLYRCSFCVVRDSHKLRCNSVQRVVDEMEMLQREYATSYIYFMDSLFMGDRDWLFETCDEIRRRQLTIRWGTDAHVHHVTPEVIRAMAAANCYELSVGIESGVQSLLNRVRKGTALRDVERAVRVIKDNSDIRVEGLFILGLPGERYEDSLETIRFACSLPLDMAQFSVCTPYPGSALFEELRASGILDTGVRADGSLDPSVWARYAPYICFTDVEPIWVTPALDVNQLRKLQKRALRRFYLRPSRILAQARRLRPNNVARAARIALKGFF
jgi:anaerobic magnesium-protoporphyrin IX monomethyl ester cyclase